MHFEGLTGRGVRVGIIDSGVNPQHPHVGGVAGGVHITAGGEDAIYLDYLGHGTAVAGAIREKAPEAELYAVKVFDRALNTSVEVLLRAIEWCLKREMHVINLSLGTINQDHRPRFELMLERAAAAGVIIVGAHEAEGRPVFPGCLDAAIGVGLDWACPRDRYRCGLAGSRAIFLASGYARPIPGVPPERNLNGISFAVANMAGFVVRARQAYGAGELRQVLAQNAVS